MCSTLETKKRIEEMELKDRFIAENCLRNLLKKATSVTVKPTEIEDHVDLNCSCTTDKGKTIPFNVEIKERNKSQEQLDKYGYNCELRVDKYQRMRAATPKGTKLYYMVLFNNDTMYLFDMDSLDWSKVEKFNWRIKRTQMSDYSDYVTYPTYKIPLNLATITYDYKPILN